MTNISVPNRLIRRVTAAVTQVPSARDWSEAAVLLLAFGATALPAGVGLRFLHVDLSVPWRTAAGVRFISLLFPALVEELFFRLQLIPHPREAASQRDRWLWAATSWLLFAASHPLKLFSLLSLDRAVFADPIFLLLASLLGLICTASYLRSGSLWPPALIHWAVAVTWLLALGGYRKLHG